MGILQDRQCSFGVGVVCVFDDGAIKSFERHLLWNRWTDWNRIKCKVARKVWATWSRWSLRPYKNLWKSSSQESNGQWPSNLVHKIGGSGPIQFVQMIDWPWLFYGKVKLCHLGFCMGKKVKQWISSDSIPACNIKIGLCKQLNVLFFINTKG